MVHKQPNNVTMQQIQPPKYTTAMDLNNPIRMRWVAYHRSKNNWNPILGLLLQQILKIH